MAWYYPNLPAPRIAYDLTGAALVTTTGPYGTGTLDELPPADLRALNDEQEADGTLTTVDVPVDGSLALVFPEPYALSAISFQIDDAEPLVGALDDGDMELSYDTTNGQNGAWTNAQFQEFNWNGGTGRPAWRTYFSRFATFEGVPEARGIRLSGRLTAGGAVSGLHLYGEPMGQDLEAVRIYPYGTGEWMGVPRGSLLQQEFSVYNRSESKTAHDVVLSWDALTDTDTDPTIEGMQFVRLSAEFPWKATATISAIPPLGAVPFYAMIMLPAAAPLGLWTTRLVATPTGFS